MHNAKLGGESMIAADGSREIAGSFGWMGRLSPYPVASFQEVAMGKSTFDQKVTGPSGWKFATVTLHNHSLNFLDWSMSSFSVGCELHSPDGPSVSVSIWAEVDLSVQEGERAYWSGTITAVVDWYG